MIQINIPEVGILNLAYLILDYNGTIATDGFVSPSVREKLNVLSKDLEIYVVTADTNGNATENLAGLPLTLLRFPTGPAAKEKLRVLKQFGENKCIFIGNGLNDMHAASKAALSIGIIGNEGMYSKLLLNTDIIFNDINDALDSLLKTNRIVADLRG